MAKRPCHPSDHRSPCPCQIRGHPLVSARGDVQQCRWPSLLPQLQQRVEIGMACISGSRWQWPIQPLRQTGRCFTGYQWNSKHPGQCIAPALRIHADRNDGVWNGYAGDRSHDGNQPENHRQSNWESPAQRRPAGRMKRGPCCVCGRPQAGGDLVAWQRRPASAVVKKMNAFCR